ncbi:MAG: pirin family protein [Pseudomonadota bacterium]
MNTIVHRAGSRGVAEHGWLHSHHTFSFADYYDPRRMGFGKLRVINDDVVKPGAGFGTHPHDNMEIVSIPLSGSLRHEDSMGNKHIIRAGEIQIMSAGTGLTHSEYNGSDTEKVKFLQVWVLPKYQNIDPRYAQKTLIATDRENQFDLVVSPDKESDAVWINQDAWFSLGDFDAGQSGEYELHYPEHGVYVFVIDGSIAIGHEMLNKRDAIGLTELDKLIFVANASAKLLIIEVPMQQG